MRGRGRVRRFRGIVPVPNRFSPDESPTSVDTRTLNSRAIHHTEPFTRRRLLIHADRVSRRKDLPRELQRRQASAHPPSMF